MDTPKVISLEEFRAKKEEELGDDVFAFRTWDYDDEAMGYIDGKHPICLLLDPEGLEGIALTVETARQLRDTLTEMLEMLEAKKEPKA